MIDLDLAIQADEAGLVDYIAIGPVFRTPSKDTPVQPLGLDPLWDVVVCVSTPVVAIGGITGDNIKEVLSTGIQRVAVIGGILGGGDPGENARRMRASLDGAIGIG